MDSSIVKQPYTHLHIPAALSWGLPDAEKDCLTPHCFKSAANVLDVYCWKVSPSGRSISLNAFLNVAAARFVSGILEKFWKPCTSRRCRQLLAIPATSGQALYR